MSSSLRFKLVKNVKDKKRGSNSADFLKKKGWPPHLQCDNFHHPSIQLIPSFLEKLTTTYKLLDLLKHPLQNEFAHDGCVFLRLTKTTRTTRNDDVGKNVKSYSKKLLSFRGTTVHFILHFQIVWYCVIYNDILCQFES